MNKITVVDIQHKTFKRALQGYDRTEVDQFLDEIIETLEDDAQQQAALEAEISDLKERISHFKAMEESLQNTLLLAQRTADEVKASVEQNPQLTAEERARTLRNMQTIILASNRRVDIRLSTTGEVSTRQFPFNAEDALTLIGGRTPVRKAAPAKKAAPKNK